MGEVRHTEVQPSKASFFGVKYSFPMNVMTRVALESFGSASADVTTTLPTWGNYQYELRVVLSPLLSEQLSEVQDEAYKQLVLDLGKAFGTVNVKASETKMIVVFELPETVLGPAQKKKAEKNHARAVEVLLKY